MLSTLEQVSAEVHEQAVAWRRHLHRHPELSFQEYETSRYIADILESFGVLEISRPTPTSVVAKLVGAHPGKTLALRADMDALPIDEAAPIEGISLNPGVMHACGHDGHTATLLAVAKVLSKKKELLHGEIRFIFQHAEEMPPGGARELVAAGVMDGVDWVVGEHLASLLPVGQIGIAYGQMMASPDCFTITLQGYGGHAGFPHNTVDVITIGAQIVTNLQHIVARYTDPLERLVVSITQFTGGASHNVIPDQVIIKGTVRSFSTDVRAEAPKQIERIAQGIASAHGAKIELDYVYGYDPVVNDETLTRKIETTLTEAFGAEAVVHIPPSMGGEDFSAYQQVAPGTFINIGAGNVDKGIVYPHHHPKFMIDEAALPIGIFAFIKVAETLLEWDEA